MTSRPLCSLPASNEMLCSWNMMPSRSYHHEASGLPMISLILSSSSSGSIGRRNGIISSKDIGASILSSSNNLPVQVLFNRYFTTHRSLEVRQHYSKGIAMALDVGDSVLEASLEETRDQINRVYEQNSSAIQ